MNDFELIDERAHIRQGMMEAYTSMGMEICEAWRIVREWDRLPVVVEVKPS